MKEERDHELERLLGEYRDDLRRQVPSADILARLQQEAHVTSQPRRVLAFPSRRAMGGLAIAASLLVMVAVFRSRPEAVSETVPMAKEVAPVAALPSASAEPADAPAAKLAKQADKPKEIPSPRPEGLPSMQALNETSAPSAVPPVTAAAPTVLADAEAKAESAESDKRMERAEAKRVETPPLTLVAVIVQEVWPPGQLGRVTTGSYQRLPDGREVRSVLTPVEAPPLAQNSYPLAAPSQQMQSLGQARRSAPVRDQMQEARARIAAPQLTPLGETVIEGYRCTGTRTLDGERTVERWRSAELGLDLLVRITDAQGGQTVTRYTRIERR